MCEMERLGRGGSLKKEKEGNLDRGFAVYSYKCLKRQDHRSKT